MEQNIIFHGHSTALQFYDEIMHDLLEEYGVPKTRLWAINCMDVKDFKASEYNRKCNLKGFQYVLFYYISDILIESTGFNNLEQFNQACKHMAKNWEAK